MHKVVSSSGSHCWCQPCQETDQLQMWQFLFTLFVSLVRGNEFLWGIQYLHILQTQTRFIIQLSTPYRVTLCPHHVTLSLHWLEAATVNSFLDSVTSLLFTEGRNVCERKGGREGHNEGKGHRKGHWKEQGKGEDEEERGRDGMR